MVQDRESVDMWRGRLMVLKGESADNESRELG